ncbi:hypothetical protein NFI96_030615 [Prochilodus magdalenae]|nr:hypothetical protein NFI96_030615 [Prochilodus magdalenae]
MAGIQLYLSNASIIVTESLETGKGSSTGKDFECVELGELKDQDQEQSKEKTPRRVIHFSSGETMEEYSTEEEDDSEKHPEKKDLLSAVDTSKLTWGPYVWFQMWRAATSTVSACDYLGERMASLFGITSAKYQYAIDEFDRMKKEKEEEVEESRLSEEAESRFQDQQSEEGPKIDQPEAPPAQDTSTTEASSIPNTVAYPWYTGGEQVMKCSMEYCTVVVSLFVRCCLPTMPPRRRTPRLAFKSSSAVSLKLAEFGLAISTKKTKVLGQDASSAPCISTGDCTLDVVEDFTCLGSTISSSLNPDTELNSRIGKASSAMARLSKRVWDNSMLTIKTKITVYQACVHFLRRILGISWQDHIPNKEVLARAGTTSMFALLTKLQDLALQSQPAL